MRNLELAGVRCEGCRRPMPRVVWSQRCVTCYGGSFEVDLERTSSGFDLDGMFSGYGVGSAEVGYLVSAATDDLGGPGLYFRTHASLQCGGIPAPEIAEFLAASFEERIRTYIGWKRREVESRLPENRKICGRCKVAFPVYDNDWHQGGYCSKSCQQADSKSRNKPS